jgi:N utilization substance protein A
VLHVEPAQRGPKITLSRSHPDIVRKLFELEVPEIYNGVVEIKAVAREAGSRSKIAVTSTQEGVDPIGACVGQKGTRVQTVMAELGGEKIDIIEWSPDSGQFVADSLSPAKILEVTIEESEHKATAVVSEDQQSLAIGKGGQNVRLAAKLTGWKIDIKSIKGEEVAHSDSENKEKMKKSEDSEETVSEKPIQNETSENV